MFGMFDQEQLMSPGLMKRAMGIVTITLAVMAVLLGLQALDQLLFKFQVLGALKTLAIAIAAPASIWLLLRYLGEILLAQHRLNDRLTILTESLREQSAPTRPAPPSTRPEDATIDTQTSTVSKDADTEAADKAGDDNAQED